MKIKYIKKIRGKYICKKCDRKKRQERRKDTISKSGIGEELKELDKKVRREYARKNYAKNRKTKKIIDEVPKIKGSIIYKRKKKSQSHITFHEKQDLFRILIRRGLNGDEAKERISNLVEEQKRIRLEMKNKNKPEEDIKIKQQEMLEELWNY